MERANSAGLANRSRGSRERHRSTMPDKARLLPRKEDSEESILFCQGPPSSSINEGRPSTTSYINTPSAQTPDRTPPPPPAPRSRPRNTPQPPHTPRPP